MLPEGRVQLFIVFIEFYIQGVGKKEIEHITMQFHFLYQTETYIQYTEAYG